MRVPKACPEDRNHDKIWYLLEDKRNSIFFVKNKEGFLTWKLEQILFLPVNQTKQLYMKQAECEVWNVNVTVLY